MAFNDRETRQEQNLHASLRYLMPGVTAGVRNVYTHDVRSEVAKDDAAMWLVLMGQLLTQIERARRCHVALNSVVSALTIELSLGRLTWCISDQTCDPPGPC